MSTQTIPMNGHFWGSVNTWECDENDHQNVRFYAHKVLQALQSWALETTGRADAVERVTRAIRQQHIRFLAEARAATPVRVDVGALAQTPTALTLLAVMRHSATETPLAAFTSRLDWAILEDLFAETGYSSSVRDSASGEPPAFALPRGLKDDLPRPPSTLAAAIDAGYHVVGRGVIGITECQQDGLLCPWAYIGRVSDGMPNLGLSLSTTAESEAREDGRFGGAALEYLLEIVEPLRQGDVFVHLSGVSALAEKTQTLSHVVINARTGSPAMQAAAVGVSMDLVTRRAIPIPDARRERLRSMLLRLPAA